MLFSAASSEVFPQKFDFVRRNRNPGYIGTAETKESSIKCHFSCVTKKPKLIL